jgi:phosphatidylethanolamine/phosphatidyl-N-methylethanolamine N-methyltransferase
MELSAVEKSYARWAPVYDRTFGAATNVGRKRAVEYINTRSGRVLEVGVGTGLALPHYKADLEVHGFDYSQEMLNKASAKVSKLGLSQVKELRQMDARSLDYPDGHFDTVAAMHVLSVVPEPEKVMAEIARVVKPGGQVVMTNHFKRETGFLAMVERALAPVANVIGWHSDFPITTVLQEANLKIVAQKTLPPMGMMTFLVLEKDAG